MRLTTDAPKSRVATEGGRGQHPLTMKLPWNELMASFTALYGILFKRIVFFWIIALHLIYDEDQSSAFCKENRTNKCHGIQIWKVIQDDARLRV